MKDLLFRNVMLPKWLSLLWLACLAALPGQGRGASLLVYWDFNNVGTRFSAPSFGTFATTDDAPSPAVNNGEIYNPHTKTLTSNAGNFPGAPAFADGEISLGGVAGTPNYGTVNTTGFGVFQDAGFGTAEGDTAEAQGSLIFINLKKDAAENPVLVFRMSGKGFKDLSFDMVARMAKGATEAPVLEWAYSMGGTDWTSFTPQVGLPDTKSEFGVFVEYGIGLPEALNDADLFYLRLVVDLSGPECGTSFALDNVKLSGTPIGIKSSR